jgi:hypothetical protein
MYEEEKRKDQWMRETLEDEEMRQLKGTRGRGGGE